uniref:CUB and sushi domain-containing protein 3-like n=1 Tax=Myxine glutinosa TaxID=7769 RepID=UPI00358DDE95
MRQAQCSTSLHGSEGSLLSPGYPRAYSGLHSCVYSIIVQPGGGIQLTANDFNLGQKDFLKVHDGANTSAPSLGTFTGTSMRGVTLNSTSNHLLLEFNSDNLSSQQGFRLTYKSFELLHCADPGTPAFGLRLTDEGGLAGSSITFACEPGYTLRGEPVLTCRLGKRRIWDHSLPTCVAECGGDIKDKISGAVLSPSYPEPYGHNLECIWMIEVNLGYIISLRFSIFDTEELHDVLRIWDGHVTNGTLLRELSGSVIPADVHSTLNFITLHFDTDFFISKAGFSLHFSTFLASECHEPGVLLNGSRSGFGRSPGDVVRFHCDPVMK